MDYARAFACTVGGYAMSDILAGIQAKIKAPKDKENTFGKYKYRNAESILAAFKDVQPEGVALIMSDDITIVGQRLFLVATARLLYNGNVIAEASSAAMHALEKKGMDDAQITGACSSYARKYALCGLFAIDDSTDDPDGHDHRDTGKPAQKPQPSPKDATKPLDPVAIADGLIAAFAKAKTPQELEAGKANGTKVAKAWDWLAENSEDDAARVSKAFADRYSELAQPKPAADLGGDAIPY
jgi:hypothetical protein